MTNHLSRISGSAAWARANASSACSRALAGRQDENGERGETLGHIVGAGQLTLRALRTFLGIAGGEHRSATLRKARRPALAASGLKWRAGGRLS